MFPHEKEKTKRDLDTMIVYFSLSVEISYNLSMDSLKNESKKKGLCQSYYHILNIPPTPSYLPIQTQNEGDDQDEDSKASDGGPGVGDEQDRVWKGAGDP